MNSRLSLAALAASVVLCLGSAASAGCIVPPNADAMQKELLANLNAERKARGLSALALSQVQGLSAKFLTLGAGLAAYAGLALLRRDRQFLHDVICDTRVCDFRPDPSPTRADAK